MFSDEGEDSSDDDETGDRGAIFNGFDNALDDLIDMRQLRGEVESAEEREPCNTLTRDLLPQRTVDLVGVAVQASLPQRQTNEFCIYEQHLLNTDQYLVYVWELATGEYRDCIMDDMEWEGFRRKKRLGDRYTNADSFFDALLLMEGRHRKAFDMAGFLRMYPDWENFRVKRYECENFFLQMNGIGDFTSCKLL